MKRHTREKTYEYTITFLKYGKIKRMTLEAESREDAESADEKPDGQAENAEVRHGEKDADLD